MAAHMKPHKPGSYGMLPVKARNVERKPLAQLDSAGMGNHPARLPTHTVFTMDIPLEDASPGNVPLGLPPFPHILSDISQSENMEIVFNKKKETLQIEKALPDEPSGF